MRRALLLDTETTGLDPATDRVIEVGACLYDLEIGCPIESYASLMRADSNQSERANRIPPSALAEARHAMDVWRRVAELAAGADVVAAHNAEFDRSFVRAAGVPSVADRVWVCTMDDFAWDGGSKKLVEIALGYGLGVASAHRALTDVDTMARIFTRVKELGFSLPDLFRRAARPKALFYALVSYDRRQVAKDHGFRWDEAKHGKNWFRHMVPEDTRELPFQVRQVS
jgi:DNA polymerase III subunit epsilon